jgi:hypothetical protein
MNSFRSSFRKTCGFPPEIAPAFHTRPACLNDRCEARRIGSGFRGFTPHPTAARNRSFSAAFARHRFNRPDNEKAAEFRGFSML